jgi:hypothetical protein
VKNEHHSDPFADEEGKDKTHGALLSKIFLGPSIFFFSG